MDNPILIWIIQPLITKMMNLWLILFDYHIINTVFKDIRNNRDNSKYFFFDRKSHLMFWDYDTIHKV